MSTKEIRLTKKERERASQDHISIIVRPASDGGYHVFAVDVVELRRVGQMYHVDTKAGIPAACTSINRDLNKFYGRGDEMSWSGRMRPGRKMSQRL